MGSKMKILILGAGGIGGLFGGRLVQAGADLTFLVRENRKRQLAEQGLRIESQFGDATLAVETRLASELRPDYDLVMLACKAYDLDSAIEAIRPAMAGSAAVLPLLNGLAHVERLNREFGAGRVVPGSARIQLKLTPEGVVRQLNDWQTITFGEQDGTPSPRVTELAALFAKTPVEVKVSDNILRDLWMKLVHLSTVAGMTCLMRANLGEIARTPEGTELLNDFLQLNADIAAHAGYRPDASFLQNYHKLFAQKDSMYEASMERDLERGGRIESEQIIGYMLGKCREAGLPDLLHRVAYTHLKAYEQRRDANRLPAQASN